MNTDTPPTTAPAPIAGEPKKSSLITFNDGGIQTRTVEDALIFAKAVVDSGLAPKDYNSPAKVLVAWQFGAEVGLSRMSSLQSIAVINGKPGLYGDAGKALLRSKGFDIEELDMAEIQKAGIAKCTISHPRQKPVTRTFSVQDAKTAGLWGKSGPWTQYPFRQLAWRAFWFAARDAAADVLKGIYGAEELKDIPVEPQNVTPPPAASTLAALDEGPVTPEPFMGDTQTHEDLAASRA